MFQSKNNQFKNYSDTIDTLGTLTDFKTSTNTLDSSDIQVQVEKPKKSNTLRTLVNSNSQQSDTVNDSDIYLEIQKLKKKEDENSFNIKKLSNTINKFKNKYGDLDNNDTSSMDSMQNITNLSATSTDNNQITSPLNTDDQNNSYIPSATSPMTEIETCKECKNIIESLPEIHLTYIQKCKMFTL